MSYKNKHNLLYFESNSMKELYEIMEEWQHSKNKRLLSTNIQKDSGRFCCIALSNPSEVVICNGFSYGQAEVKGGRLQTS